MDFHISRHVGSYDWAHPEEKQAQLFVRFKLDGKNHAISEVVELDSKYDFDPDDIDIVDAIDRIEMAVERWFLSTARIEKRATIALFRANQTALRKAWLLECATSYQKKAATEFKRFQAFMSEYQDEVDREMDQQSASA